MYHRGAILPTAHPVRFDNETIESLKAVARRKGIGYQTLIRIWVNERLAEEQAGS